MAIILDTQKNQYGEEVVTESIFLQDGKWWRKELNCQSSLDYGFGTCRCVSHPAFNTYQISRAEIEDLNWSEELAKGCTQEEANELFRNQTLEDKILEKFQLLGFENWEAVETWCGNCYKIGMNPLPKLREHLKNLCEVGFAYDNRDQGWFWDAKTPKLVCWLSQDADSPENTSVSLEVEGE